MPYTVSDLLALLDLEPLEFNIYRGVNRDIGTGRVFGGQVLAQALVAARRTVEGDRSAHSLHGYFILPGDLRRRSSTSSTGCATGAASPRAA
jgi:acyl-CoA thioesterase II